MWRVTSFTPSTGAIECTKHTGDKINFILPTDQRERAKSKIYTQAQTDAFDATVLSAPAQTPVELMGIKKPSVGHLSVLYTIILLESALLAALFVTKCRYNLW